MPNPIQGLPVEVDVYANPPGSLQPYELDWRFQGGPSQGNTPIDLPKGSGSHDLIFTLHDNSGKGLKFKPVASDAMWVRNGNACPTAPGNGNGQIVHGSVTNGGTTLTVNDDNAGNPARLHYTLRFDPDPNSWDPEIRNGGGGRTLIGAEGISMATIGGAVAGALIAIWMAPQASVTMTVVAAIAGGALGYIAGALVAKSLAGPSAHLPG